jgi:hypothetical protein
VLVAALVVTACADPSDEAPVADDAPPVTSSPPEPDPAPGEEEPSVPLEDLPPPEPETEPPPLPAGYELVAGETGAAAKRAAIDLVEALTTYDPGDDLAVVVERASAGDAELADLLLGAAAPLHHEDTWSRGSIVYPQLGGLEIDAAAVITVVRQDLRTADGEDHTETRVLDVRVDRDADDTWRVVELASAGGEPVDRPDDLSPQAEAVLDDDRIELPDSAVWDIHAGVVDDRLLDLMARTADRTPYGVVVLKTGHSREVFGTDRTSRHHEGRAVDLYRLDGPLVIEDREVGSATYELVRWLYDQPELSEVGSPWALDAVGGRSFSDELHQDHLHIGVLRPGEAQRGAPRD